LTFTGFLLNAIDSSSASVSGLAILLILINRMANVIFSKIYNTRVRQCCTIVYSVSVFYLYPK
ncbi:MAG: hypothetical protein K1X73_10370, partial [Bacteroidia bacterium]|nr:hypothetical protein [Bacteroidia bacterium]